ncbi:MAG: ABC transporter permease [Gammaproteobacteria bacterium RIFCSPHIGHO2_12_FULL_42_13]|nr:MAG: ABC transporter permease [Gammaproteobacteria bacterium RIFCSPHIGHO2_12_FULL_42_13]
MNARTGFYPNAVALQTLVTKEIMRFMRIWSQTLIPPVITTSLYFIIFGKFIGSQIQPIHGYTYIQYIVPGLVMLSIMTNAYSNTSSSFFLTKFTKSIEEMLVSPMLNFVMLLGFMLGGTIRGILVGTVVLIISLLFTHIPLQHPVIVVTISILASMIFSLGGLVNGIYAKYFDDIAFVPTFIITPLTYLGGVFYSVNQLPPVWRSISLFNPILAIVDTFRYGFLGISDVSIFWGFTLIGALLILIFFWAWMLLVKGVGKV